MGKDDSENEMDAFSGSFGRPAPVMKFAARGPTEHEAELLRLRDQVTKLGKALEGIKTLPLQLANVVRVHTSMEDRCLYATLSHPIGHVTDARIDAKLAGTLEPGDYVWQSGGPGASSGIVGRAPSIPNLGITALVKQVVGKEAVEIDGPGGGRCVAWSPKRFPGVKAGDTVLIDRGGCVVVGALEAGGSSEYEFTGDTGVTWSDVAGLEDAKRTLKEAVELPVKYPELFAAYKKRPTKGVLFEGPPRCGKTMLAKALASSLRTGGGPGGFFHINGPEVLDKWVGASEARVRAVFEAARAYKAKHGRPAVIFIDEADALLTARGTKGPAYAGIEQTMVPQFLAEMDGLEASGAVVLLATNRASQLDPAVLGHGRVDRTIYVPRPTQQVVEQIFGLALADIPVTGPRPDVPESGPLAEAFEVAAARDLFADAAVVKEVKLQGATITLRLRDVVNGAMVVAVVEIAKTFAQQRDLEAALKDGKAPFASGVRYEDVSAAIKLVAAEEQHKNHSDELVALAPAALKAAAADASKPALWTPPGAV